MTDWLKEIWVELIAAVVLGGLSLLVGRYLHRSGAKLRVYWYLLQLCKSHILRIYRDWDECEQEIAEQLKHSEDVAILCIKGRNLSRQPEPFRDTLQSRVHTRKRTRILLQSPASRYVSEEVSKTFGWRTLKAYREDLAYSIRRLTDVMGYSPGDDFKIALYDAEPLLKLYLFDNELYVGFYVGRIPGVWCLQRRSDQPALGSAIESHFESLWKHSVPPTEVLGLEVDEESID
jgi:hypothetical protein